MRGAIPPCTIRLHSVTETTLPLSYSLQCPELVHSEARTQPTHRVKGGWIENIMTLHLVLRLHADSVEKMSNKRHAHSLDECSE
jgi:hypothetical protein